MEKSMSLDTDFKNLKETLQDVLKLLTKLMKITWHLYTMLCVMVMWRLSNCCWSMEQVNQKHTKQSQPLVWPSDLLYVMLAGRDWWISIQSVNNTQDWWKFWKRFRRCFVFQKFHSSCLITFVVSYFLQTIKIRLTCVLHVCWQLVNTANAPLLSLQSNLFVSTGELTHPALLTNCKSDPPLWLVKRKWHLWQLSSAVSQHESEILNDLDQRLSFLSGSVLRSVLRVANFQIKEIV